MNVGRPVRGSTMGEDGLEALRREIDRIDAAMHDLLMERGAILDRLVAAKRSAASGSAFRPRREAAMMQAFAARHSGRLPFETVEAIWRIVISTFTHLQVPFAVWADAGEDAPAVQDSARFHFGFTVPYRPLAGADEVVAAVAGSRGDLGLVPSEATRGAWWRALVPPTAPKVIARLPFVPRPDHPAGLRALVLAREGPDEGSGAISLWAAEATPNPDAVAMVDGEIVAIAEGAALLAVPAEVPEPRLREALRTEVANVGGHPPPVLLPRR